jgi:hypothetical protein
MENKNLYENVSLDEAANLVVKRMRELDKEVIEECINKKEQEELGRLKNENNMEEKVVFRAKGSLEEIVAIVGKRLDDLISNGEKNNLEEKVTDVVIESDKK